MRRIFIVTVTYAFPVFFAVIFPLRASTRMIFRFDELQCATASILSFAATLNTLVDFFTWKRQRRNIQRDLHPLLCQYSFAHSAHRPLRSIGKCLHRTMAGRRNTLFFSHTAKVADSLHFPCTRAGRGNRLHPIHLQKNALGSTRTRCRCLYCRFLLP